MKIGDLVKWEIGINFSWIAIVVGETQDVCGRSTTLVQWVTGNNIGDIDLVETEDLEVIG